MPEQQIVINAPQEKVFSYLADITKHAEWGNPSQKLQVTKTSDGPIGQGATFQSVGQQFGRQDDTVTIKEYAPNRRIVYESQGKAGLIRHSFDIEPSDGGGVQVTKRFEAVQAKLPFALFLPMVSMFVLPGALKGDLERIKAKVEGS